MLLQKVKINQCGTFSLFFAVLFSSFVIMRTFLVFMALLLITDEA
jgi:hypothetical protein